MAQISHHIQDNVLARVKASCLCRRCHAVLTAISRQYDIGI